MARLSGSRSTTTIAGSFDPAGARASSRESSSNIETLIVLRRPSTFARMRITLLTVATLAVLGGAPVSTGGGADPAGQASAADVGQRIVTGMRGSRPSAGLLRRVRRGEVGGVILFGWNV